MASPFEDRLAEVEAKLGALSIGDLPFAAMQRKLESDWQPDAAVLLGSGSVTTDMLAEGAITEAILPFKLDGGRVTITWPGGSPVSSILNVPLTFGVIPTSIALAPFNNTNMVPVVSTLSASTLGLVCVTKDGTSPAAAFARDIYWTAFLLT